jgi:hypothetical protein
MIKLFTTSLAIFFTLCSIDAKAQVANYEQPPDSIWQQEPDSIFIAPTDPIIIATDEPEPVLGNDNQADVPRLNIEIGTSDAFFAPAHLFRPTPRRAVIYSAIFPGLGQAYNRQFWKIPIVFGGFAGITYAISWNGGYFRDYQAAFMDIRDGNPDTNRWHNFLPYGRDPATIDEQWFGRLLEQRRDLYRHYRDLSIILAFGLYLLVMIDAYVDARLFDFSMSRDLSMRLSPTVINQNSNSRNRNAAYGFQWSFSF